MSAICGQVATPFHADVFIAHFGPAGVTAAKLRELCDLDTLHLESGSFIEESLKGHIGSALGLVALKLELISLPLP